LSLSLISEVQLVADVPLPITQVVALPTMVTSPLLATVNLVVPEVEAVIKSPTPELSIIKEAKEELAEIILDRALRILSGKD